MPAFHERVEDDLKEKSLESVNAFASCLLLPEGKIFERNLYIDLINLSKNSAVERCLNETTLVRLQLKPRFQQKYT